MKHANSGRVRGCTLDQINELREHLRDFSSP